MKERQAEIIERKTETYIDMPTEKGDRERDRYRHTDRDSKKVRECERDIHTERQIAIERYNRHVEIYRQTQT